MARVIVNAQQKGGVGKTTDTVMEAIVAASVFKKKVLVIDTDLQANATAFLGRTYDTFSFPMTLMKALSEGDLSPAVVKLTDRIDLIPSGQDMRQYTDFLIENFDNVFDRTFYLKKMIEPLKEKYDYIFIDVPPSTDLKVDNAMVAADYVIVIQETQQFALDGSKRLVFDYLTTLVNDFGDEVTTQIAGVLPVLLQKKRELHQEIIYQTKKIFGRENVFRTIINNRARLEWYPRSGVQFNDYHDKKMFAIFSEVFNELEERIWAIELTGEIRDNFSYKTQFIKSEKITKKGKALLTDVEFKEDQLIPNKKAVEKNNG